MKNGNPQFPGGEIKLKLYIRLTIASLFGGALIWFVLLYRRIRYGYCFRRVRLTRGQFAKVDPADYGLVSRHKWYVSQGTTTCYAARWVRSGLSRKRKKTGMHREIMGASEDVLIDHINHDGLDNRRANLRPATYSQNLSNRHKRRSITMSRYKGLEWDKRQNKYKARISVNGRKIYLGSFGSEEEAAAAYDNAARKYHKEYACLNFGGSK